MTDSSYADLSYADQYMQGRMFSEAWTAATNDKKQVALTHATRIIDRLNYVGWPSTEMAWPRAMVMDGDPIMPIAIYDACVEIALALVKGVDPEQEYRQQTRSGQAYGSMRVTRDTEKIEEHITAGVPSRAAWDLLSPYFGESTCISIQRA